MSRWMTKEPTRRRSCQIDPERSNAILPVCSANHRERLAEGVEGAAGGCHIRQTVAAEIAEKGRLGMDEEHHHPSAREVVHEGA